MRRFEELTEAEILALAVANEEDDQRIYINYAEKLRGEFPAAAGAFDEMAADEAEHRRLLFELFRSKFGDRLPFIRREHVKGFLQRRPLWLLPHLRPEACLLQAEQMEDEAARFYRKAADRALDIDIRKLLGDLALVEAQHEQHASELGAKLKDTPAGETESARARHLFVLQIVQPSLAGLMDGSVSTLAPLFAAAFATKDSHESFLVGLAAAIGAGISMGFAEALSDDGKVTGRGKPWIRGLICGLATTLGGVGHTLPFLIGDFWVAAGLAVAVVMVELAAISWIRARYMDTPLLRAAFQVVVGGILVFLAGVLIGSA
ncbi:MAG: ferritin family protein [Bauldia sp.]